VFSQNPLTEPVTFAERHGGHSGPFKAQRKGPYAAEKIKNPHAYNLP